MGEAPNIGCVCDVPNLPAAVLLLDPPKVETGAPKYGVIVVVAGAPNGAVVEVEAGTAPNEAGAPKEVAAGAPKDAEAGAANDIVGAAGDPEFPPKEEAGALLNPRKA